MLSDFGGINMLCTFWLVVYCFFNCIFKISECSNVRISITFYGSKHFSARDMTLKFPTLTLLTVVAMVFEILNLHDPFPFSAFRV